MWVVCTKTDEIIGFTLPMGVTDKEKCKPIREEYGQYDGWGSRYPDSSYEIILTGELHSKFLYLTYESEPLWVDFIDECLEGINEEELDVLAWNEYPDDDDDDTAFEGIDRYDYREAYKAGYRKAKENK